MKTLSASLRLLRFTISSTPLKIWTFPIIQIFLIFVLQGIKGERSGFEGLIGAQPTMALLMVVGLAVFSDVKTGNTSWASGNAPIPYGEFLLCRPITRKQAYWVRIALFFVLTLGPWVIGVGVASRQPAIEFSLYRSASGTSNAVESLSLYQAAFPESRVIQKENKKNKTLIIPHADTVVAAWQLLITTIIALSLQIAPLLRLPSKIVPAIPALLVVVFSFPLGLWDKTHIVQRVFFSFASHLGLVTILILVLIALTQWFAISRARHLEII